MDRGSEVDGGKSRPGSTTRAGLWETGSVECSGRRIASETWPRQPCRNGSRHAATVIPCSRRAAVHTEQGGAGVVGRRREPHVQAEKAHVTAQPFITRARVRDLQALRGHEVEQWVALARTPALARGPHVAGGRRWHSSMGGAGAGTARARPCEVPADPRVGDATTTPWHVCTTAGPAELTRPLT